MAIRMPKQRTEEWRELRRGLITSTDLPVILGLSPYRAEGDLAREKLGQGDPQDESLVMQIGAALEPVIASEYLRQQGVRLRRFHGIVRHPSIAWAAASPDFRRQGARWIVEAKSSVSRRWDGDEIPQDVEAQLRWTLGCTGYPIGEVALLHYGKLRVFPPIEHDQAQFDDLVTVATDFRRRMAEGGPFTENTESVRRAYPGDDGTAQIADDQLEQLVADLVRLRAVSKEYSETVDKIETAVRLRMGFSARLEGRGWHMFNRRAKDSTEINWQALAANFRRLLEAQVGEVDPPLTPDERAIARRLQPDDLDTLVSIHTSTKAGSRRLSGPYGPAFKKGDIAA